ncbi:MAG TPA: methyltransferase domain-containing protein [Acidimicrobiales bacterium]|nr:methyltransferase domain-containing protein [Acidimicrobiales bacterium]
MSPDDQVDVEQLVSRLRARVQERREQGQYPPGLESDLSAHFERIVAHRPRTYDLDRLRKLVDDLENHVAFDPTEIPFASEVPGGVVLHRLVAKLVHRQVQGVLEQVSGYARAVQQVFEEVLVALDTPDAHDHPNLVGRVDAIFERLGQYERAPADSPAASLGVLHRLEQLEQAEARRTFRPWFPRARLEEELGTGGEKAQERYAELAEHLAGCDPVVDLGCGRGEFVAVLEDRGIRATGVEADPEQVRAAGQHGLAVERGDAVTWLAGADDGSLGGLALLQVVEHLTAQEVVELVALGARKVRPGGRVLVETVNPTSLYVFAHSFYRDPTHTAPVHPAYLEFLFREAGFAEVEVHWRTPVPEDEALTGPGVERLNDLLFAPQDYALVATR